MAIRIHWRRLTGLGLVMGSARVSSIGLEPSRKGLWAPDVIDARNERARTPVAGLGAGARTLVLLFVSFMVVQKEGDPVYNAPLGTGRSWSANN